MADRKVLNKYYPPDFDPTKLPRMRANPVKTFVVRIMAPFNMRCNTCGEYIYKGKKFNSKKEDVLDMDYMGLKIFRFFIKCTRCLAEISFRTDPENTDYVCEQGANRNFQAHDFAEQEERRLAKMEKEDEANPMKVLEKRTKESKNEMDVIDALEELKDLNARNANASIDTMLDEVTAKKTPQELADEEDARIAREMFEDKRKSVKRLAEEEEGANEESDDVNVISNFQLSAKQKEKAALPVTKKTKLTGLVVKKKKVKQTESKSEDISPPVSELQPDTSKPSTTSVSNISKDNNAGPSVASSENTGLSTGLSLGLAYSDSSDSE